jgi:hypothetical protein
MEHLSNKTMKARPPFFVGQMIWENFMNESSWYKIVKILEDSSILSEKNSTSFNVDSDYASEYVRLPGEPECPPLPDEYIPKIKKGVRFYAPLTGHNDDICWVKCKVVEDMNETTLTAKIMNIKTGGVVEWPKSDFSHVCYQNGLELTAISLREEHAKPGVIHCVQCNESLTNLGGMIPPYCKKCEP